METCWRWSRSSWALSPAPRFWLGQGTRSERDQLAEKTRNSKGGSHCNGALSALAETTRAGGTDFGLGLEARARALVSQGPAAERCYQEAIERLGRAGIRTELGRAHLLYGEWLRREKRRVQARDQLRAAHEMLDGLGMAAFAERAGRELQATGETVRKRAAQAGPALTEQEAYIARLARDGATNPEIGTQLFLSARTIEWHLRKIFAKLGIGSRRELRAALAQLTPDGGEP